MMNYQCQQLTAINYDIKRLRMCVKKKKHTIQKTRDEFAEITHDVWQEWNKKKMKIKCVTMKTRISPTMDHTSWMFFSIFTISFVQILFLYYHCAAAKLFRSCIHTYKRIFGVFWIAPISAHGTWLMNEYTHRTFSPIHTFSQCYNGHIILIVLFNTRKNIDDNWQNSKSTTRFVAETVCLHFFFSHAFGDDSQWTANTDHRPFFLGVYTGIFVCICHAMVSIECKNSYWNSKMVFFFLIDLKLAIFYSLFSKSRYIEFFFLSHFRRVPIKTPLIK